MILLIVGLCCLLVGFLVGHQKTKEKNQQLEQEENQIKLRIKDLEKEYLQKNSELDKKYSATINEYDKKIEQQEHKLKEKAEQIYSKINSEKEKIEAEKNQTILDLTTQELNIQAKISKLESIIVEKQKAIEQFNIDAKSLEDKTYDLAAVNLEHQIKELYNNYEHLESELKLHYTDLADSVMDTFIEDSNKLDNEILTKKNELSDLQKKINSIIEVNKRNELEKSKKDFYRLQLSNLDIEEIKKIRSIEPYLRQKEPLNKVIWKIYYEKPYNDLIGRIIGNKKIMGIYKITNMLNGKIYIGQSVDIAERFRQHIKRGIGADTPTQSKLYPAMLQDGVENFTFEIIEECPQSQLSEREKFYTDIYEAQSFGYVTRKG